MTRLQFPTLLAAFTMLAGCSSTTPDSQQGTTPDDQQSQAGEPTASSGSSGVAGEGGTSGAAPEQCVNKTLSWGVAGAYVSQYFVSTLNPCAAFTHERIPYLVPVPPLSCTQDLDGQCEGRDVGEVMAALADNDVTASIAAAPVVYGFDARAADQGVFEIVVGDAIIDVGAECGDKPDCVSPPQGIQRLMALLQEVTADQLKCSPCSAAFP